MKYHKTYWHALQYISAHFFSQLHKYSCVSVEVEFLLALPQYLWRKHLFKLMFFSVDFVLRIILKALQLLWKHWYNLNWDVFMFLKWFKMVH